ncbi:1-deoxy-D-xylulose-5-phosphate synthase [Natranaerofaba carboxydovora]|uniref:1-deoxy-D-xylulose-5-phosphate synthase n=1 Tax=Natranaerofaba carboxydovora TaxID=2742683 RepID=UPI001F128E34|nr:1-deoxy-D-xylulose-5-phosphate synthase [Natranaerofaba carboxydovora]UMZ73945.1 1-deoxy-D-xylulose-5-phosphate synthase [Natranaerofaba carboxydovora]
MENLLNNLSLPGDLKNLETNELQQLADEIRENLIVNLSGIGGHLAPNLGVVELTLSLYNVFSLEEDKFIWDVGHQAYVHKMLTGRLNEMSSIRQFGGISAFPNPEESQYDAFKTGHSSTSISAALGLCKARDLSGGNEKIISVIGDGALTGGMAFEALNQAGHEKTDIKVILNDNEMSIGENVGAMSSYLTRIRTDPKYQRVKEDLEFILKRIPAIGGKMVKSIERVKDTLKYLLVSGLLFEELGFTYLGPVDGHNITTLKQMLKNAKATRGPVLVHVVTKKGKGYLPAENEPDLFHGVGPFDKDTGDLKKSSDNEPPTYSKVFGDVMTELAEKNNNLLAITAAMCSGTGLDKFKEKYPRRFFDVGIAEQHAVTFAAGLAKGGYRPVVAIYSTFLQRAYDQIVHDVCLQKLPVTFAIDRAGIVGGDGETHQGLFDLSYLRTIPNIIIMAPKDEKELKTMLSTAFTIDKPVAIRYPKGKGEGVNIDESIEKLEIGKGEIIKKGKNVALICVGSMVKIGEQVLEKLNEKGVNATLFNARFVKPLDENNIINLAKSHNELYTLEENSLVGGFGSGVLELLSEYGLADKLVVRFGINDKFVEHGDRNAILDKYGLSPDKITAKILKKNRGEKIGLCK